MATPAPQPARQPGSPAGSAARSQPKRRLIGPAPDQEHLQEHIDLIAQHELDFLANRTPTEKLADRMAQVIGSLPYVAAHFVLLGIWTLWNMTPGVSAWHFDIYPFPLLNTILAFEAILVASFILMRQARMSRRQEERDHLMLQMLLLTEREMTAVLGVERRVAERVGLTEIAGDEELSRLSEQTQVNEVVQRISEQIPNEQV